MQTGHGRGVQKGGIHRDCVMELMPAIWSTGAGLWLLSIDANVYLPLNPADKDPQKQYGPSSNNGYNRMVSHKQVMVWAADVADRAKREGSPFGVQPPPDDAVLPDSSREPASVFGSGGWISHVSQRPRQAKSRPNRDWPALRWAYSRHDTAVHKKRREIPGQSCRFHHCRFTFCGLQTGELWCTDGKVTVRTVRAADVPRFNDLFEHYREEHKTLSAKGSKGLWDVGILSAKNYFEFYVVAHYRADPVAFSLNATGHRDAPAGPVPERCRHADDRLARYERH